MKHTLVTAFLFFVSANMLDAQDQYFVYDAGQRVFDKEAKGYRTIWVRDSIKVPKTLYPKFDYSIPKAQDIAYLKNVDLGQYLKRNDQIGFIGLDYQRFHIAFLSATKKTPWIYSLKGKTLVKGNICDFHGDIKIDRISVLPGSYYEDEYTFVTKLYKRKYGEKEYSRFMSVSVPENVDQAIRERHANDQNSGGYYEEMHDSLTKYEKPYRLKFDRIRDSLRAKNLKITRAYLTGRYSFQENPKQLYSGLLVGNFSFDIGVCYDSIHNKIIDTFESDIVGDRGSNYSFWGVWISNATMKNKICSWGVYEPPYAGRLSTNSVSVWYPKEEYRDKGWGSYLKCHHDADDESCKKEMHRWWD
jgi:hypothetical protein